MEEDASSAAPKPKRVRHTEHEARSDAHAQPVANVGGERHSGRELTAEQAEATPVPLTAEEAVRQSEAEGLPLVRSERNNSGFL